MRLLTFILSVFIFCCAKAQVTITVTAPANTPQGEDIYIAGSFNNWSPSSALHKLTKNGALYTIELPASNGTIKFKFTRGSWATVEGTKNGSFIADRQFTYGNGQTINLVIEGWEDQKAGGNITALPNVQTIATNFVIPQLGRNRRVLIYLPDNYAVDSPQRYPVLYMHDGQNVFDAATAFAGEWGVDETLNQLEKNGGKKCIVVAIDNGTQRIAEYTPFANPQYGGGEGDKYADFIVQTLKPYIDANFRTLANRENTAIAGSSLGGLISLYTAIKYQQTFSKIGVFSPAYWINKDSLRKYISTKGLLQPLRIYTVAGQNESLSLVGDINDVEQTLTQSGFAATQRKVEIKTDGAHSEWFWKREFGAAYQWLFANNTTEVDEAPYVPVFDFTIHPNPANTVLTISFVTDGQATYTLYDVNAKVCKQGEISGKSCIIDISELPAAIYRIEITKGIYTINKSFIVW